MKKTSVSVLPYDSDYQLNMACSKVLRHEQARDDIALTRERIKVTMEARAITELVWTNPHSGENGTGSISKPGTKTTTDWKSIVEYLVSKCGIPADVLADAMTAHTTTTATAPALRIR